MHYLILALATWRLSNLLVNEDGPADMFLYLRSFVGVREFADEQPNAVAGAFTCIWCMSVWVGALFGMGWLTWGEPVMWLALPLALSAVAIVMDKVM